MSIKRQEENDHDDDAEGGRELAVCPVRPEPSDQRRAQQYRTKRGDYTRKDLKRESKRKGGREGKRK